MYFYNTVKTTTVLLTAGFVLLTVNGGVGEKDETKKSGTIPDFFVVNTDFILGKRCYVLLCNHHCFCINHIVF